MKLGHRLRNGGARGVAGVAVVAAGALTALAGVGTTTVGAEGASSHYLAFASDVHGLNDKLATAFVGMPSSVEYVGLIGDMVGEGGGAHPEYKSSDLLRIAQNAFPRVSADTAAIVWADHDISVDDDAGIVKIWNGFESDENGHNSGEILETDDYYIYVVGYYHMLAGGSESQTAAQDFKEWVDGIDDKTKPVIMLGHVPLAAKRGDNNGALYWNEALNYAATGVEGLNDATSVAEVERDVFYFYGHNHTVDKTEYCYAPGGIMNVQIDTATDAGTGLIEGEGEVKSSEATDEELGTVRAQGIDVRVYYNALITGYIKTSGNATLMEIGEKKISLTKYNGGEKVSLCTDGTTGEILGETVEITRVAGGSEPDVEPITPLAPDTGRM